MVEKNEKKNIVVEKKEKKKSSMSSWEKRLYSAISIFIALLVVTIWIYFYNNKIVEENKKLKEDLVTVDAYIEQLENDEQVKIYNIYSKNKDKFDLISKKSDIPSFLEHLEKLYYNNNLKFKWFSLYDWKISVWVIADSDKKEVLYRNEKPVYKKEKTDYEKVYDFLSRYETYNERIFKIKDINKFIWWDEIKFNIIFELEDNL